MTENGVDDTGVDDTGSEAEFKNLLTPDALWALLLAVYDAIVDADSRESLHDMTMEVLLNVKRRWNDGTLSLNLASCSQTDLILYVRRSLKNGLIDDLRRERNRVHPPTLPNTPFYRMTSRRLENEDLARPIFELLQRDHPKVYQSFILRQLEGIEWADIARRLKPESNGNAWRVHCKRTLEDIGKRFRSTD
jgi:hypothetical protein